MRAWMGLSAAVAVLCAGAALANPPVEAFGRLPDMASPQIAPDGKHFSVIQSYNGKRAVVIYTANPTPDQKPVVIAPADWIIGGALWLKSDRLAVLIKVNRAIDDDTHLVHAWSRAVSVDFNGGHDIMLLSDLPDINVNTNAAYIVDRDVDDPNDIFMSLMEYADLRSPSEEATDSKTGRSDRSLYRPELFRVDAHTGKHSRVLAGTYDTRDWYMDGHGRLLARLDQSQAPLHDRVLALDGTSWRTVAEYDASGDNGAGVEGVTEDGTALVRAARDDKGMGVLVRLDLKTGNDTALFSNPKYDADSAILDPSTDRVIGAAYTDDKREIQYFDPKMEALQKGLEAAFPGVSVRALSWNTAKDEFSWRSTAPSIRTSITSSTARRTAATRIGVGLSRPAGKRSGRDEALSVQGARRARHPRLSHAAAGQARRRTCRWW